MEQLTFGEWMRRRRSALGLTQNALAQRISYDGGYVRRVESGERQTTKPMAQALAEGLEIPAELRPAFLTFAREQSYDRRLDPLIGLRVDAAPVTGPPSRLPNPPTPLVGREQTVGSLCRLLLRPDTQLVTLVGAAGTGKTRVAIQAAADVLDHFPDGAWFVDLAPITDPALVLSAVAQTLGVRQQGTRTLRDTVLDTLERRQLLLVLDNFEQLLPRGEEDDDLDPARQVVTDVRAYARKVKLLVTSRQPLQVRGEKVVTVPPLEYPDLAGPLSLERLADNPAVRLFVARAQDSQPDFALTHHNALAVAEICGRLDGLPLAIEIAAPRTALFTPEAMLDQLTRSGLEFLTEGPYDLPRRQRTMSRAIAWSYRLLDAAQQRLLRRLAVFVGGATVGAVEDVAGETTAAPPTVSEALNALVRQNLIRWTEGEGGERRIRLLETIREYALERLQESGEWTALRQRHAAFFVRLGAAEYERGQGPELAASLDRLEREHANIRAVLDWYLTEAEDAEPGLRLAGALWRFWRFHGHLTEGRTYLESMLARTPNEITTSRASAVAVAGMLAYHQCLYDLAERYLTEALGMRRALGDTEGVSKTLINLGLVQREQGRYEAAREVYEECLALIEAMNLRQLYVYAQNNLGRIAWKMGDTATARQHYAQVLAMEAEMVDDDHLAHAYLGLAHVAVLEGDSTSAPAYLSQSLERFKRISEKRGIAQCLEGYAELAFHRGQFDRAARLLGTAEKLREMVGSPLPPADQPEYKRLTEALHVRLGEVAFETARATGQELTLEEAIRLVKSA